MRYVLCFYIVLVAIPFLTACSSTMPSPRLASIAVARVELAPTGNLRAAINFGNPVLANRDAASAQPRGVSIDLARELANRLGVPIEFIYYPAAGKVVEGIKHAEWDIAFFAVDPVRATDADFSAAYMVIEGAFVVPAESPLQRNEDVDREGVRVVVGRNSAYDLYLTRELKKATLVRAVSSPAVTDMMVAENIEAAAGVKQQLQADAKRLPGLRLLDGRFMVIKQATAIPKGRPVGAAYLVEFVEEMKSSGFVEVALRRHGINGAVVAPAAR